MLLLLLLWRSYIPTDRGITKGGESKRSGEITGRREENSGRKERKIVEEKIEEINGGKERLQ